MEKISKDKELLTRVEVNLNQNALKVLEKRYLTKNEDGIVIETPYEMFLRVARHVASADLEYGKSMDEVSDLTQSFLEIMTGLEFLPNSPTLMNAGKPLGQLSACFVIPVDDTMESIFDAVKAAAIIHKTGGGTGFSFSRLRPKGDIVGSTKGISSGPVSFMSVFNVATEAVKQGGTRRGANMGILRIDHPDILEFITCKDKEENLANFNISVAITEEFMRCVIQDREYELRNPRTGLVVKTLRAREVFDLIVNHAWQNGEPGIVFIDRINKANPTPHVGEIESTNPCGEQPLLPYESCNLGSINLSKFVKYGKIDWERLKRVVHLAVHFLDNVIDVNRYPFPEIERMTKANRKIGLGVMGWADMLIKLRIPYNSEEALKLAEEVGGFIQSQGRIASMELAKERGVFPNFRGSIYDPHLPLRNATITTIAPTGTLSIIAGCSSGIEPLFAISFVRNVLEGARLLEVNPYFEEEAKKRGFWSRELMERIAEKMSLKDFPEIPEDVKKIYLTAHDITPEYHVRMQAAFQKYVDNAVSKTVNFPNSATPDDVKKVYMLAYELGLKGVTVYRDGSREKQVITKGKKEREEKTETEMVKEGKILPRKRPERVDGATLRMKTGCGNLYITINQAQDGHLFEVFTHMGKAGGCAASQSEAIGRLVSLALRSNIAPQEIIKQLKGISCHQPAWHEEGRILSCSDAIAKAIEKYMGNSHNGNGKNDCNKNIQAQRIIKNDQTITLGRCPECGGPVEHEGGCVVCRSCGFTRCG